MEEIQHMKIGANIAALRRAKGLTQEQLAAALGVSAPAVSKWERNSSYPDITLLCPLARALETSVDELLQFHQTLSDQETAERIRTVVEKARQEGVLSGEKALEELLHQYPSSDTLRFQAAAVYDVLWMLSLAQPDQEAEQRWCRCKRSLLQQVRASGSAAYWQSATVQLAGLVAREGETDQAEALLRELPEHTADPTPVWVQCYLKKEQPEEALKTAQRQLYRLVSSVMPCLTMLLDPRFSLNEERVLKICRAYQSMARAFGFPDMSEGLYFEAYLGMGQADRAEACFVRYVEVLTGPFSPVDEDLFAPGITPAGGESGQDVTREMRRMLLREIEQGEKYHGLRERPAFAAAVEKLRESL